jgi:hypothetical protein
MLPEAYYGTWELAGTSGGLDGMGVPLPEGPRDRVVLTRENIWKQRGPDGSVARPFTVRKGKTIFSADDQWMVVWGSGRGELVLQLAADEQLTVSENVYDGFSSSYRRVASSP